MTQHYVTFSSDNLFLDGAWHLPEGDDTFPGVVVCHPHSLYGGEMENNVVMAICQELCRQGIAAFRFNFRGAGGSQGTYDNGIGEQEDVKAALSFVAKNNKIDSSKIGLAGYSFGAGVALSIAPSVKQIKALALISPPFETPEWGKLSNYKIPKLIISGSEDAFFSAEKLMQCARDLDNPKIYEIIPGPDHFWGGYEEQLAVKVTSFFIHYLSLL